MIKKSRVNWNITTAYGKTVNWLVYCSKANAEITLSSIFEHAKLVPSGLIKYTDSEMKEIQFAGLRIKVIDEKELELIIEDAKKIRKEFWKMWDYLLVNHVILEFGEFAEAAQQSHVPDAGDSGE